MQLNPSSTGFALTWYRALTWYCLQERPFSAPDVPLLVLVTDQQEPPPPPPRVPTAFLGLEKRARGAEAKGESS